MKFHFPEGWFEKAAKLEDGANVSAGVPDVEPRTPWIRLHERANPSSLVLLCNRCGATYALFVLPVSIDDLRSGVKTFVAQHRGCKP